MNSKLDLTSYIDELSTLVNNKLKLSKDVKDQINIILEKTCVKIVQEVLKLNDKSITSKSIKSSVLIVFPEKVSLIQSKYPH